jgi:hypothetical protein
MQRRDETHIAVIHGRRRSARRILRFGVRVAVVVAITVAVRAACAQEMMPGIDSVVVDPGAPPMTEMGGGDFFSQELGTIFRVRYNTESYGQSGDGHGNLDLGTMQVATLEDSIVFFDGQVTLNDVQGVGFNVGLGYRWMSFQPYANSGGVVQGVSIWADGTSTEADNFFPQLGLSYESLGDMWDMRVNGYIPLGDQDQIGDFAPIGEVGFEGNSISQLTQAIVDSSFYAGEAEFARRLGSERDAWVFAGPYFLANEESDTAGYRVGVRGYAYPDLLLQFAVSEDDIFNTNATFSLIWFVGRTRTDFRPACGVPDRLREPVMRNDYVVLAQSTQRAGVSLTDPDGEALRIVHVDSSAPAGGDGTFENPLNNLEDILTNSQNGDLVLVHAESQFTGQEAVLRNDQRFLGEGDGFTATIDTADGEIDLPETAPGARDAARPLIANAGGDAVTIRDNNEVANFDIEGGTRAIVASANGAGNPNLHDLAIESTTGDAIVLTPFVRVDTEDADDDGNVTERTVAFNVTIDDVTFDNIGGTEMNINAFTTENVTDPNVTLQETITLRDITSTNGNGMGLWLRNTHDGRTATIMNYMNGQASLAGSGGGTATEGVLRFEGTNPDDFDGDVVFNNVDIASNIGFAFDFLNASSTTAVTLGTGSSYDGGTGAAGGLRMDNFNGTITASNTTFTGGTLGGVRVIDDSDGTFTFQNTFTMTNIGGTDLEVDGGAADLFTGVLTYASNIVNTTGRSVVIRGLSDTSTSVTVNGDITDTADGILVDSNAAGDILFSGDLDLDTTISPAILVTNNNTAADISFAGEVDITTTSGAGFTATGGGTLTASNTNNSISTNTGRVVEITGMTISSAGVNFGTINRTAGATNEAILLQNNTGGPIVLGTLGDDQGESGTIVGGTTDAIAIENSANVTISGLAINNTSAVSGVRVLKNNASTMTLNLNDLAINTGDIGVEVVGGGTGALTMTLNDTDILGSSATGLSFNNVDAGTIQVNNLGVDGNGAATVAGIQLTNSNANFTFDSASSIQEVSGIDFEVNGGTGTVNMGADITNTAGRAVQIHNVTGGEVVLTSTSSINDNGGTGILINDNSTVEISFLGTNTLNTGANDAVTITNNDVGGTNAIALLSGLNITTTGAGRGIVATLGGTFSATGVTNQIDTENGAALEITDMNIGLADFAEITVDGATAANGIILRNLTGGQFEIGTVGGADGSAGTLNTTGTAIEITNAQNVAIRNIEINNAATAIDINHDAGATTASSVTIDGVDVNAATTLGLDLDTGSSNNFSLTVDNSSFAEEVDMDLVGSGSFTMVFEDSSITTGTNDVAFAINMGGAFTDDDADVTIQRNTVTTGDASAFTFFSDDATSKTINLLLDDNTFENASANATNDTVNILAEDGTTLNATIFDNMFANTVAAGDEFDITANTATANIQLNLSGNSANSGGGTGNGEFDLHVLGGATFDIFEKDDTINNVRNDGTVVPDPNAAAFGDATSPPPTP